MVGSTINVHLLNYLPSTFIGLIVIFVLQKYLQKYNYIQPPGVVAFFTVSAILNQSTYSLQKLRKLL